MAGRPDGQAGECNRHALEDGWDACARVDGWTDGWMDGWMGWVCGSVDGSMGGRM
jgi:hypothetical protein